MNNTERKILAVLMVVILLILAWIWFGSFGNPQTRVTDDIEDQLAEYQKVVDKCSKKLDAKTKTLCDKELLEVSKNLSILESELKNLTSEPVGNNVSTSTTIGE